MLTSVGGPSADPAPSAFAATAERSLQLEVFVNDRPVGLIAAFTQGPDGRMRATRGELAEIGVKATGDGPKDAAVALDDIAGLHYVYEERKQIIRLRLDGQARLARDYGADAPAAETPKPEANWAAVLNYNLFSSTLTQLNKPKFEYQGASATLDGRISTPMGVISQTGIVGSNIASSRKALRLDTNWTWSDPRSLITYRAGDTISSGLAWTRPVRMGGAQIQRNFGLRPDLVTLPLPSLGGTAAVPSTLDVYVNNVKTFTQQVDEGPYRVNSLPLVGSGTAKIVVRDSTGRETQQENRGIPAELIAEMLSLVRDGKTLHSLEAELAPVPLAGARKLGLPDRWIQRLEQHSPDRRQVLSVTRLVGGSPASQLLRSGDLILDIEGAVVNRFREVERAVQKPQVKVTVLRDGAEQVVDVPTVALGGRDLNRILLWAGAVLQQPHRALSAQRGIPPNGVFVGYFSYGSPATRYQLWAGRRIVEVDGQPTPDLDAFIKAVSGRPDRSSLRLRTMAWNGAVDVITLKLDKRYWPTYELNRTEQGWVRTMLD